MRANSVIGVDLGGTKIYTALASLKGDILAEIKIPTQAEGGFEHVISRILYSMEEVKKQARFEGRVIRLGIGAPGPLDPEKGLIYHAPNLGWRDTALKSILEDALHIPVSVDNDANLAALGEHIYGAGRGVKDMAYVTVSTGIGSGLVLAGKIYHGAFFNAGEIGHMTMDPDGPLCKCGNRGCLETLASGTAIARLASELVEKGLGREILKAAGSKENITSRSVYESAMAGDREAMDILKKTGRYLGIGLANMANLINPALIILGGGVMQAGVILWPIVEDELKKRCSYFPSSRVRLASAALGQRSGLMGAVALALEVNKTDAGV